MAQTYRIVLDGSTSSGPDRSQVLAQGARIFKIDQEQMDELLNGKPRVVKRALSEETARRYVEAISQAGIVCHMEAEMATDHSSSGLGMVKEVSCRFQCPKCGHCAAEVNGDGAFEECPRCGIVVQKYMSQQAAADASAQESGSESSDSQGYEPASIWQRWHAAFRSWFVPCTVIFLIGLVPAIFLYLSNLQLLSKPAATFEAAMKLMHLHRSYYTITGGITTAIWIAYFIYYPVKNGKTWAQGLLNIQVVSTNPEKHSGVQTWLLRAVANFVLLVGILYAYTRSIIAPSAVGVMCLLFIGVLLLLPLLRKDRRSFADLISGTRQVRQGPPIGSKAISTLIIVIMALPISFGSLMLSRMLLTPSQQVNQKAATPKAATQKRLNPEEQAQLNRQILEQVSRWEERHLKDYGSYAEDPMELFQKFGDTRSKHALAVHHAIMNDWLRLELTDSGFRAMIPAPDAPDTYQVYTENGDQGVQTVTLPKSHLKRRNN